MSGYLGERIAQIEARRDELQALMATGDLPSDRFVAVSKEHAELEPVARAAGEVRRLRAEPNVLGVMEGEADPEIRAMAREEIDTIRETLPDAERALALSLLPRDAADERAAMLEIRAGTGGDEAALFAGDLFRMYQRYAESQGWKVELISASSSESGGFKEAIASVEGKGVFAKLKFESGVHRVQRVPVTEAGGRIHTLGRDRGGAARGGGGRRQDRRQGSPHRHLPLVRAGRAIRQHDRFWRCASSISRPGWW